MMMDTSMKGWQQRNMPDPLALAGNKMELGLQNFIVRAHYPDGLWYRVNPTLLVLRCTMPYLESKGRRVWPDLA